MPSGTLTRKDQLVIDFERSWWLERGGEAKRDAIRRCLDMSASGYHAAIARLIETPEALAYDPLLVRRLRRRRDERRRARFFTEIPRQRRPH